MKKALFGFIMVITIVCFCGIIPSTADDTLQFIFGEEMIDVADDIQAENAERAAASLNHINAIYTARTATAPSQPILVFSAGSTVYLTTLYYMANTERRTIYYFITNIAGSVVAVTLSAATVSAGERTNVMALTVSTPGTYVFNPVIIGVGNDMLPQSGFIFIVE